MSCNLLDHVWHCVAGFGAASGSAFGGGGSAFGQQNTNTFGAASNAGGLFGQPATGGLFGQQQQQPAASSASLFGGGGGLFGQQPQSQSAFGARIDHFGGVPVPDRHVSQISTRIYWLFFMAFAERRLFCLDFSLPLLPAYPSFFVPSRHKCLTRCHHRAGSFGQQSQPANTFGGTPAWGQQSQAASGFGNIGQQSQGGLFGQPAQAGGGLFGQQQSSAGLFGTPAASPFGQQSSSAFGAASSGGLFGQPAQQGGGLFGAASAASPFGAASGGAFGSNQQAKPGGLFGSTPNSGGGLFGAQSSAGGLFGAASQSAFGGGQQSGGGLFGAQSGSSLFGGGQSGGGLFGASSTPAGGGLFSQSSSGAGLFGTAAPGGGGLFGGSQSTLGQPASSGGLFGNMGQGGGGLFGGQQQNTGQTGGGLFGNTGGLFGNQQQQQQQQQQQAQQQQQQQQPTLAQPGQVQPYSALPTLPPVPVLRSATDVSNGTGGGAGALSRQSDAVDVWFRPASALRAPRARRAAAGALPSLDADEVRKPFARRAPSLFKSGHRDSSLVIQTPLPGTDAAAGTPGSAGGGGTANGAASPDVAGPSGQSGSAARRSGGTNGRKNGRMSHGAAASPSPSPQQQRVATPETPPAQRADGMNSSGGAVRDSATPARQASGTQASARARSATPADTQPEPLLPTVPDDFYTQPPLKDLKLLAANDPDALKAIHCFTVGKHGIGEVMYLSPVDVSDSPNLGEVFSFSPGAVSVYEDAGDAKPPVGTGLNAPARVQLQLDGSSLDKIVKKRQSLDVTTQIAKIQTRLQRLCVEADATFVAVDMSGENRATWTFEVKHWSRYFTYFLSDHCGIAESACNCTCTCDHAASV